MLFLKQVILFLIQHLSLEYFHMVILRIALELLLLFLFLIFTSAYLRKVHYLFGIRLFCFLDNSALINSVSHGTNYIRQLRDTTNDNLKDLIYGEQVNEKRDFAHPLRSYQVFLPL